MIHVIAPFAQANATWLGLGDDGHRRKVFKVVDQHINASEFLVGGLTIFEPGEASSPHDHPRPHGNLPRT